tara:strand:- start:1886 stop:2485 length:600 start_codon:yes stop_codon:yes gene_type:complete
MADTKISAMPNATTPLTGAELVPLVQSGVNVKSTISAYNDFVRDSYFNHGAFSSDADQTGSITAGTAMTFTSTDITGGVTLASSSRLTVPVTGDYNVQFSAQFENIENTQEIVTIWFRINGVDVPNSATNITIPSRKNAFINGYGVASWNIFLGMTAGQYVEIVWLPAVATVTLQHLPASVTPAYPAIPSVIATVNQIS